MNIQRKKRFLYFVFLVTQIFAQDLFNIQLTDSVLQPDGKILAPGQANGAQSVRGILARYNTDGSLDATFGQDGLSIQPGGAVTGTDITQSNAIALQPDGKILVAGTTTFTTSQIFVARFNPDGSADTSFGAFGFVVTPIGTHAEAFAIALQSDDKIVVGATTAPGNGHTEFALVRYINDGVNDGDLDTSYGMGGIVTQTIGSTAHLEDIAIQPDDFVVAAGRAVDAGHTQFALARFDTNGDIDPAFGTGGTVLSAINNNAGIQAIKLQDTGEIVVGGFADNIFAVARYTTAGDLDLTFNGVGFALTDIHNISTINDLVILPTGEIVVAGFFIKATTGVALAKYDSTGNLVTSFGTDGIVFSTNVSPAQMQALLLQTDDNLVTVGFNDCGGHLIRFLPDGSLDTSFGFEGFAQAPLNTNDCTLRLIVQRSEIELLESCCEINDSRIDLVESCCESHDSRIDLLETCCDDLQSQIDTIETNLNEGNLTFNAFSMWKNSPTGVTTFDPDESITPPPYDGPSGSPAVSTIVGWSLAPSAGDPTALDPINVSFEVPADFDPSIDPEITVLILANDLGGTPNPGPIALRMNFDFKSPGVSAIGPGFAGMVDSDDITVEEPVAGTLTYIRHTFNLTGASIAPGDWAYASFHRIEPSTTEYNQDVFMVVVTFKYFKL